MSDIQPEITPLPDGTYSVETAMGTTIFQSAVLPSEAAGPQKLSDARLAEMRELHEAWLVYRAEHPAASGKEAVFLELVRGQRRELLDHADAQAKELADLRARFTATEAEKEEQWAYANDFRQMLDASQKDLAVMQARAEKAESRLHQEQQDAADQAAQLLVLHEENRKTTPRWVPAAEWKPIENQMEHVLVHRPYDVDVTWSGYNAAWRNGQWTHYSQYYPLNVAYVRFMPAVPRVPASLPVQGEPVEGKEGASC